MTPVIPLRRIQRWRACSDDYQQIADLYPEGVPLTLEAAERLQTAGVDVLWGAVRLLQPRERREFVFFTLRQRQPHLVALLRMAGLPDHAAAVAGLTFETSVDAEAARTVLVTARDAAWDTAWDAARDAAWDAARDAAWDAAGAAAWDAAGDAAGDAARAAATREQVAWIAARVLTHPAASSG